MFEGQPKGLFALALANTGERFGYYVTRSGWYNLQFIPHAGVFPPADWWYHGR